MNQSKKAFTLIELIIVVVIISILALIAIPKYFANVAKAQKSQVYANLDAIRQAMLSYYAAYGTYPTDDTFPITVTLDGEMVISVADPDPSHTSWEYRHTVTPTCTSLGVSGTGAYRMTGSTCYYWLCVSGYKYQTCTP
ncbi:MAG: prepilin-type N-terminal cleavage/methylation domain-containing protein [Candidatus Omnitrophica bacterium]|jgi:prepilin-type N-terminal cleavage/methylation domain-containing protein|nr:prepilin-type N-terminal cleavage/methylation domain-containing protein [Candidatus Omnitrophota bacterium]